MAERISKWQTNWPPNIPIAKKPTSQIRLWQLCVLSTSGQEHIASHYHIFLDCPQATLINNQLKLNVLSMLELRDEGFPWWFTQSTFLPTTSTKQALNTYLRPLWEQLDTYLQPSRLLTERPQNEIQKDHQSNSSGDTTQMASTLEEQPRIHRSQTKAISIQSHHRKPPSNHTLLHHRFGPT